MKEILAQVEEETKDEPALEAHPLLVNQSVVASIFQTSTGRPSTEFGTYRAVFTPYFRVEIAKNSNLLLVRGRKVDHEKVKKILAKLEKPTEQGIALTPGGVTLRSYPLPTDSTVIAPLADLMRSIVLSVDEDRKKLFVVGRKAEQVYCG